MSNKFNSILIIYNPFSTSGKAEFKALRLYKQLKRRGINNARVIESQYPGHSEELAFQETLKTKQPLIISVSGDGGYNSVINGALRAQQMDKKAQPICAILAAGNANDHRRAVAKKSLLHAIVNNKPEPMDILEFSFGSTTRFAHSYIGVGTTAEIASELNVIKLSRWKEIKIVARNLLSFRDFAIRASGRTRQVDSLVFANIHRMAKVIKLSEKTHLDDGLFTLVLIPHRTRLKFLFLILWLAIFGAKDLPQLSEYSFKLLKPQLAQLDGEALAVPANTTINVRMRPGLLETLR